MLTKSLFFVKNKAQKAIKHMRNTIDCINPHSASRILVGLWLCSMNQVMAQTFSEVTDDVGLTMSHSNVTTLNSEASKMAGGGAAADVNQDGWIDLYLLGGTLQQNKLFINQGNGQYAVSPPGMFPVIEDVLNAGPLFIDIDDDRDLDMILLSMNRTRDSLGSNDDVLENRPRLFINDGQHTFSETLNNSFTTGMPSISVAAGDLDLDGDLDLFITHWNADDDGFQYFWENDGSGHFTDVTHDYLGDQIFQLDRFSFTPNITDINGDGWPDVLLASDFGTSRIFLSNGITNDQLSFNVTQPPAISDENGMGAAVGDYDNDGDMDWFVTSIWDPDNSPEGNWGVTGNRLYQNDGSGQFTDVTDQAGVRQGYWGWGSCFADFNNDGHLDIFHENGFPHSLAEEFHADPARLFISNQDGTFTEQAVSAGITHTGQGRGVSCFDHDRDGDLDILIMPNGSDILFYENNLNAANNHLFVRVFDETSHYFAVGTQVVAATSSMQVTREVKAGNNFVSNNPYLLHFGLGTDPLVSVSTTWPDGDTRTINAGTYLNQQLNIFRQCHLIGFQQVAADGPQTATIDVHISQTDGQPATGVSVSMAITTGPGSGQQNSQVTNAAGVASFVINHQNLGTDKVEFSFTENQQSQQCHSLIQWLRESPIFRSGFEPAAN